MQARASPNHLDSISAMLKVKKDAVACFAMAFASSVLPVPGRGRAWHTRRGIAPYEPLTAYLAAHKARPRSAAVQSQNENRDEDATAA